MYENKFMENIGYPTDTSESAMMFESEIHSQRSPMLEKHRKKLESQRKEWGNWDERVGSNLNTLMLETFYTWLCIYRETSNNTTLFAEHNFIINDKTIAFKDCVDRMIKDLEFALTHLDDIDEDIDCYNAVCDKIKDCFYIYSECFVIFGFQ